MQDPAIARFKADVGFDRVAEPGGPSSGVVFAWPRHPTSAPQLVGNGWQVDTFDVAHRDDGAEGEWILKNGEQTILLRAFVSSRGVEPARRRLLEIAAATMMVEIPYRKTRQPIGTLSVTVPGAEDQTYVWFFHNVCFHVRGIDTDADLEGFGRWIQTIVERGLTEDVRPHLPPLDRVEIEPSRVGVGDSFTVRAVLAAGAVEEAEFYTFDFLHEEQALELEDEDVGAATFRAVRAGDARVQVHVVDTRTLLASSRSVLVPVMQ